MDMDSKEELKRLKNTILETGQIHQEERGCLLRIINTFGTVVAMHEEMAEELKTLKALANTDQTLPRALIEAELGKLKNKIIAGDSEPGPLRVSPEELLDLKERFMSLCRMMRQVMDALLEGFYPLSDEMAAEARAIDINCRDDVERVELEDAAKALMGFIERLKIRISEDFRQINRAFLLLLDQVKELEKTLSKDFGGEDNLKKIEHFEANVHTEVASIIDSFDIHRTIHEIKSTVIKKITNIKRLVAAKKKEEIRRAESARENINGLKNRIDQAEKDMLEMRKMTEKLKTASERDGLTDLYNRIAFDSRIEEALKNFQESGVPFSLILFDVDGFKDINDTLGHVAGDKVLQKVAQCLGQTFRKNDFIARYGGDEFVIIVENLTKEMARERILNFRNSLKKIRFTSYVKGDIDITVSAGIALAVEGDTPERVIRRADKAMYDSKHHKNQ
jgi:diguanylate cyclase (GGDEF)-like protein